MRDVGSRKFFPADKFAGGSSPRHKARTLGSLERGGKSLDIGEVKHVPLEEEDSGHQEKIGYGNEGGDAQDSAAPFRLRHTSLLHEDRVESCDNFLG